MRILHFCPESESGADGIVSLYLSALMGCMEKIADTKLVHVAASFQQEVSSFVPDIVHIHACWNHPSAQAAKWAHGHNIPVVLSPHGKLNPWVVDQKYLPEKLPKLLLYQHEMICNADAIIVSGEIEMQSLSRLSWNEHLKAKQPWNNRIEIIQNSIITNNITDEEMTAGVMRLYRKVLDSNAWLLMSPDTREAEDGLLRQGIARNTESNTLTDRQHSLIGQLDEESWRRLFIHADEEDVSDIVKKAIDDLQLNPPPTVIENIDRFPSRLPKQKGPLSGELPSGHPLSTRLQLLRKDYGECRELDICYMIANISHETRKGTLSRRHLTEIYEKFRYTDFNEDLLAQILKRAGLYDFTLTLQQTLDNMLGLTEGFMPLGIK